MTLLSRFAGLARDIVFANYFGARAATDAFFVAFKIPNFLRRLFAEGAFSQAFVPVLVETKTRADTAAVKDLIAYAAGALSVVLLVITALGVIGAPLVIAVFGAGFLFTPGKDEELALSIAMLRLTFPYILFISLSALAAGVLNAYQRFAVPAFTPVLLNLVLIAMAIGVSPYLDQPVMALAWGVLIAGVAQLAFQLPFLYRLGLLSMPRWGWRHAGVVKIRRLMLPALFGSSVLQISLLLDTLIASFLVAGSVTWIYFSDRLVEFPLGVFGVAIATVILPGLSQRQTQANPAAFFNLLDWAMRWVVVASIPAMVGLLALAGPTLSTLFGYGGFSLHDVRMSGLSLMAYTVGLPAFVTVKVLAPGFFARQDTKTPVKAALAAMAVNVLLKLIFVALLLSVSFQGAHAGLALATALAGYINCGLLYYWLRRDGVYRFTAEWRGLALKTLAAAALMGLALFGLVPDTATWHTYDVWGRVARLLFWLGAGATAYAAALLAMGIRLRQLARPL